MKFLLLILKDEKVIFETEVTNLFRSLINLKKAEKRRIIIFISFTKSFRVWLFQIQFILKIDFFEWLTSSSTATWKVRY